MRGTALGVCVACLLLTAPTSAAPASADDPALQNIEALGNREPDRWQGRHHYLYDDEYQHLYDDEYQPGGATVGSAPSSDARACSDEPVRLRRSDGSTVVRRFRRCD
jgi:hypothetical protein